mmetsp:Transcript_17245/g.31164  ORF Transcript_17245/g.31164 Transcript_17245/m.31164 type:complete len:230 (-) Transcript_17245:434-1123(-)
MFHNSSANGTSSNTVDFFFFSFLVLNPSIPPTTGTFFNATIDPELVAFTARRNASPTASRRDENDTPPPDLPELLSCERDTFDPCFSNADREAISRFKSRFVCSKVLLRISRSAVKLTENATNSSYLRRKDATSSYSCSGLIFSVLVRLSTPSWNVAGREPAPPAGDATPAEDDPAEPTLPVTFATIWRTCNFLLNTGTVLPDVAWFHIAVSDSTNSFLYCPPSTRGSF